MSPNKEMLDKLIEEGILSLQTVWNEAFAQMSDSDAESILTILGWFDDEEKEVKEWVYYE